jgi:preprotein translocase subunit SecF
MLIYIWVRFGSLLYSAATIIGVIFNVAVCLGMLAMSKWIGETSVGNFLRVIRISESISTWFRDC